MKQFLMAMVLMAVSVVAMSAEDFTVWESQTFAGPYVTDTVAVSPEYTNTQSYRGLEVIVEYEALSPDGQNEAADYKLSAIVEQKAGVHWYPIAMQFAHINHTEGNTTRIIVLGPNVPDGFNGTENLLAIGERIVAGQSYNSGTLGGRFRIRLTVDQSGAYDLTSATVTVYGRKID